MALIEKLYQHADPPRGSDTEREHPLPSADLGIAAFGHRIRAEALRAFVAMERRRLQDEVDPRIDVTYALLDHIDATGFDLSEVDLSAANLIAAHLIDANLENATLRNARLGGGGLIRADLTGANLEGADLIQSYLTDAKLTNANLSNADLTGANLIGANLTNAKLFGANFSNAVLVGAVFEGCSLTNVNFSGAILHEVVEAGEEPIHISEIKALGWIISEAETDGGAVILVVGGESETMTLDPVSEAATLPTAPTLNEQD